MKKAVYLLLGILLISNIFVGCSDNKETTVSQKTEEELRAEIRAEMEAEEKLKGELESGNLDWALEYINKDISEVLADKSGGDYSNDYSQWVEYDYDDYTLSFRTADEGFFKEYPEDFESAGITENTITSIYLRISHDLYDDENETIVRYPEISIGGVSFGMDLEEAGNVTTDNGDYYIECSENYVYSKNKVVDISVSSQLQQDVLDGKYAPKFQIEPLDPNTPVKKINIGMTKEEIINILGMDYEEKTIENEIEGGYDTYLTYDGVTICLSEEGTVNYITISTNKVSGNFDINVGNSALEALQYCEENFKNVMNPHGMENEVLFGIFEFEDGISLGLTFNKYGNINSMEDVKEDTVVQEIRIFYTGYVWGV